MLAKNEIIKLISDIVDNQNDIHIDLVRVLVEVTKALPAQSQLDVMTQLEKAYALVKSDIERVIQLKTLIGEASE